MNYAFLKLNCISIILTSSVTNLLRANIQLLTKSDVVDALQDVLDLTSADLRLLDDLVNIFYLLDELSRLLDRFLQERDSLLGL